MKLILLTFVFILTSSCSTQEVEIKKTNTTPMVSYSKEARSLMIINDNNADGKELKEKANQLITYGSMILEKFKKKFPQCSTYLDKVKKETANIKNLNIETLDTNFHEDIKLPETDDVCVGLKELIIHPSAVVILANELIKGTTDPISRRIQINDEMAEVIGHLALLNEEL
jgi:hypothetical protein